MRVALFTTCLGDALYPRVVQATAVLLTRLGCEVVVPDRQTCCGQMHMNSGYQEEIMPMVENFVETFSDSSLDGPFDYIVSPSGSCVGAIRDYHVHVTERFTTGEDAEDRADAVFDTTMKVLDLPEFLIDVLGVEDVGGYFPHRVTYHPSCHGLRFLGLGDRPYRLLKHVDSLEFADLPQAEECCGFGGTFSLKNPEVSAAMVADKVANIAATGAEFVAGGDGSCLLNIGGTLSRSGSAIRPIHVAEILASTREHPWSDDPNWLTGPVAQKGAH
ncbi:MAG: (Fe-S)-binding protein [Corynebacterium sp.]|nr:(Fe-S)-binding protein [Corynebacterium sp.]